MPEPEPILQPTPASGPLAVGAALRQWTAGLARSGIEGAGGDVRRLIAAVIGVSAAKVLSEPERVLTPLQLATLSGYVRRRAGRELTDDRAAAVEDLPRERRVLRRIDHVCAAPEDGNRTARSVEGAFEVPASAAAMEGSEPAGSMDGTCGAGAFRGAGEEGAERGEGAERDEGRDRGDGGEVSSKGTG